MSNSRPIDDHTLLIWEAIPEETTLYLIPHKEVSPDVIDLLVKAHGQIINTTSPHKYADVLNYMLSSKYPPSADEKVALVSWRESFLGCLEQFKMTDDTVKVAAFIVNVVRSGYMM